VYDLENMVCPWIGCGGTIVRKDIANPERVHTWACNSCGEVFSSVEDYQSKLKGENDWAQGWIDWADAKQRAEKPEEPIVFEETGEEPLVETKGQEAISPETATMP